MRYILFGGPKRVARGITPSLLCEKGEISGIGKEGISSRGGKKSRKRLSFLANLSFREGTRGESPGSYHRKRDTESGKRKFSKGGFSQ